MLVGRSSLLVLTVVACSDPRPAPATTAASPVPPLVLPPLAHATAADLVTCRVDSDCVVFAADCAHCGSAADGFDVTTVSVNKTYESYGEMLVFGLPFFSCAEGGCNRSRPQRTAFCKEGRCARRETSTDGRGSASSVEIATDPAMLIPRPFREVWIISLQHLCERSRECGKPIGDCGTSMPERLTCPATKQCYAEIDKLPCDKVEDVLGALGQPACHEAQECTREP